MSVKALQDYTFVSKYARYLPEKKRRETWSEAVDRVRDMHLRKYPQIQDEINWAFEQVRQKKILGSQRALQFGGKPIEKNNARLYNCCASYCDRLRFFQESLWLLLSGSGVGFSVQKCHVKHLPNFNLNMIPSDSKTKVFVIPDTIEGWADSIGVLLSSFFFQGEFPEYSGYNVQFDYSLIRPEGSLLGSSSGKAPGPKPLMVALEKIRELLYRCISNGQNRLRPIDSYDIVMHASDAVLSGGVRRSATLCLFSPDDEEMAKAKTGNWFIENPQRGRSNNSALLLKNSTSKEDFDRLMGYVKEFGEPGFVWAESEDALFNPCVTKDTSITTSEGISSVEDLIGSPFKALLDGQTYKSTKKGFWKTGTREILKVSLKSGRIIRLTKNHQLMTTEGWKEAGDLAVKDDIIINNHRSYEPDIDTEGSDYAKGYCLGSFLGDGNISENYGQLKLWNENKNEYRSDGLNLFKKAGWANNHHKSNPKSNSEASVLSSKSLLDFAKSKNCIIDNGKELSSDSIVGNWSYLSGLVAGYFDAGGTVLCNHKKGCSLRIWSTQLTNLRNLQIVLNAFGIYSNIHQNRQEEGYGLLPDGNKELKEYWCDTAHELIISCDNIKRFNDLILIRNKDKQQKIAEILDNYKRKQNKTNFVDEIVSIDADGMEDVYDCTVPEVSAFDANGIYSHNCVEVQFYSRDPETDESCWHFCNLCEINGKYCKTEEDWEIAARAGSIIGTCQAGYTNFPYLGESTKRLVEKEALLGVSITGMMDNSELLFDPKIQQKMASLILKTNEEIANKIGINPTARSTVIKPSGTTSCILGTASGIHPHHAKRYIRRSQSNHLEAPLRFFKSINPCAVEKSVWSANGTDEIISFCVEVPKGAKVKNDLDAISLLDHVKLTQQNWIKFGTRKERCVKPWLIQNVSNTITVKDDEWELVGNYIYENREFFAGISLLSISGDKDYPQAPFTAIYTPLELVRMYGDGSVMASGLIVDGLHVFNDNLWNACDTILDANMKSDALNEDQIDWVRRARQFSDRYFEGNLKKMTYCLKDVNNFHLWCNLQREYKKVDYTQMIEETDETKLMQESACAGGNCSLSYA